MGVIYTQAPYKQCLCCSSKDNLVNISVWKFIVGCEIGRALQWKETVELPGGV